MLKCLRWLLRFRKLKSSKKVKILECAIVCLQVWKLHHEKHFFMEEINSFFLLIFTMKLSSAALSYLNAHLTLNFAQTFLYLTLIKYQRSRIWILWEAATYFGSSSREVSWKLISGSKLSDLQLHFTGIFEDFGHIFLICSKKLLKF